MKSILTALLIGVSYWCYEAYKPMAGTRALLQQSPNYQAYKAIHQQSGDHSINRYVYYSE